MEDLRSWFNSNRPYFLGVVLFKKYGGDLSLFDILKKGENAISRKRLCSELEKIWELKTAYIVRDQTPLDSSTEYKTFPDPNIEAQYDQLVKQAKLKYKSYANKRAILFDMCLPQPGIDLNTLAKIKERAPLALEVINLYQEASELFDNAKYLKENQRLPELNDEVVEDWSLIPDEELNKAYSNAQKLLSKTLKKETTAQRLAKINKLREKITYLKNRKDGLSI